MYRVFEALDGLVAIVEEARSIPATRSCIVPRGEVLDLLDDIRESIPAELDDAQDVLDDRDQILAVAETESERIVREARESAQQLVADAQAEAEAIVVAAQEDADVRVNEANHEYQALTARAQEDSERMVEAGRDAYDRAVAEGEAERDRLVSQTEVIQMARAEAARIIDEAKAHAVQQRTECDQYVDSKLSEFEALLEGTLRSVGTGRHNMRVGHRVPDNASDLVAPQGRGRRRL